MKLANSGSSRFRPFFIPGELGADRRGEGKSKRAEKKMAGRKVKNGEKNPWEQCLTRPVPKCRVRTGF